MAKDDSMEMTVSSVVSYDGKKRIYVKFIDGDRSAEITFPAGRVISNDGFEEKEIVALRYYVTQNKAQILKESEKVNVMKAFMDS